MVHRRIFSSRGLRRNIQSRHHSRAGAASSEHEHASRAADASFRACGRLVRRRDNEARLGRLRGTAIRAGGDRALSSPVRLRTSRGKSRLLASSGGGYPQQPRPCPRTRVGSLQGASRWWCQSEAEPAGSHASRDAASCLLCALRQGSSYRNLITTTRDALVEGQVQRVHTEIRNIRGVGTKIASFFLRDVAIRYEIEPDQNRDLLQPVDRWILRFTQMLDNKLPSSAVGQWMVFNACWPNWQTQACGTSEHGSRPGSSPTPEPWTTLPSPVS